VVLRPAESWSYRTLDISLASSRFNQTDNFLPQNDRCDEEHAALAINTKDEDTSTVYRDIVPTPNDVLLGRGAFINEHSGNRRFRTLALEHKLHFDAASPTNRRQLALEIVSLTKGIALTSYLL
jgi:hypothetical protein